MYRIKIEGNLTCDESEMDENSDEKKTWVQNNCKQKRILNRTLRICRKRR